ncbi:MAG: RidA family protein [Fibrobacteres bacterium]|nr:RidA family protein [Fibrobacterota bacterium]
MIHVKTDKAPAAIGPYSQGMRTGNLIFFSGQLGIDPATGKMAGDDVKSQANQVLKNVKGLLESQGLTMNSVVKSTMFLADMNDFKEVNVIYEAAFGAHRPARSTIQVARLPLDARVEIECIAEV